MGYQFLPLPDGNISRINTSNGEVWLTSRVGSKVRWEKIEDPEQEETDRIRAEFDKKQLTLVTP